MVLLNVLVIAKDDSRVLLGWEIMRSLSPAATFETLFHEKLLPRIPLPRPGQDQVKLDSCFVGKEKHCLDKTDASFPISDVISTFGPYVKLFVSFADANVDPAPRAPVRNAFDVMMLAQRSLSVPVVPSKISVHTKKDVLYNDLVLLLEQENLKLSRDDANGKRLLKALTNALWYIDGRHETLQKRSCRIPLIFSKFQGYNLPEMSKHRKCDHSNMNSSELKALSSDLFTLLLCSFWKQPQWLTFKVHVEGLAKCLLDYSEYLGESNKKMKEHHLAMVPSRQLATNLSIYFLPVTDLRPSMLDSLNSMLPSIEEFKYVDVGEFSPSDAHKKIQVHSKSDERPLCTMLFAYLFSWR